MSIIVTSPQLSVEAAIEIYALKQGFTWRTGLYDKASKENLGFIKHAGEPFEGHGYAAFDAEQKALEKLRQIQLERDQART